MSIYLSTKKTWNFKNICLYETGKVAVSARVIGSDVRWRRIFHESILVCHNLIAIRYAKQHANCFSAFARLCLISRKLRRNFSQQFSLCRVPMTLLEYMLNYSQLITLAIISHFVNLPHLEIIFQNTMICAKLKRLECYHFYHILAIVIIFSINTYF